MHRISVTVLVLCLLGISFTTAQLNNITVVIYKNNTSVTLLKAATLLNETYITEILIEEEDVPVLKTGIFDSLFLLQTVNVRNTNLVTLQPNIFKGLKRIRKINLNFNKIDSVPPNVFTNIPVYIIALRGNGIKQISENAFYNLQNLRNLDLGSNNIELLPKNLFVNTKNLKYIDLSYNKLRHFPAVPYKPYPFFDVAFANMVPGEPSFLDLSYNNFSFISYYLLRGIYYIDELRLQNNHIKLISEYAFDDFTKINTLNLDGNDLKEMSDGLLGVLTYVENVKVENNPWRESFVCKYTDWCERHEKSNYMEMKCPLKLWL
uniref:Leucine-rich repeat-containing protein 15-like n=1 Tax=Diabrotica virgifera virgifera TaxID=50390 RepID=A0A6P7FL88_DIAVI